jgi:aspartate aminotransferase-like enzyme
MPPEEPERIFVKHRLLVPGPTPLPPAVIAAATAPMEDERTPRFAARFTGVVRKLQQVYRTSNQVLVFTASTTGAFESAVQNLFSPGERVLVASNGSFGERWVQMCRIFGLDVVELTAPWGSEIDPARVAALLAADPAISAAICVHCETSTGVVNDLSQFGRAAANVLTIVDSASGLGSCDLRTDEWGLDVVVSGSQKALMGPPGLAFASVSERAWIRHAGATMPRFYFDWTRASEAYAADIPRTPWTPAIGALRQLEGALDVLLDEGLQARVRRHVVLGQVARAGLTGMGLELVTPARERNAMLTAAYVPSAIDSEELVRRLADSYGVQIAGCTGPLAGRAIRLGHGGFVDFLDVIAGIAGIELTLHSMGACAEIGAGPAAALRELSRLVAGVPAAPRFA